MKNIKLSPGELRKTRMLDAGLELFLQFGFRGVSMGAVAQKAEVAKPTLYKYFCDKEALFQAGVARFLGDMRAVCVSEFSKHGSESNRIAGALSAKHKLFFRLVENSTFSEELFFQSARLAAKDFDEFERWIETEITSILAKNNYQKPHMHAQLLIACAFGIAKKAQHAEQIGPAIRLMVQKILD